MVNNSIYFIPIILQDILKCNPFLIFIFQKMLRFSQNRIDAWEAKCYNLSV